MQFTILTLQVEDVDGKGLTSCNVARQGTEVESKPKMVCLHAVLVTHPIAMTKYMRNSGKGKLELAQDLWYNPPV